MTTALVVRRMTVILGVALVLVLVIGAIRLAAAWTADAAPLAVAPASATQLTADVANEQARGQALMTRLEALDARSQDLTVALAQAGDRIAADAAHAADLKDRLATAKARLAKLETQLARARQGLGSAALGRSPTATLTRTAGGEHESEAEHGD
jgi:uncharacterized protein YlxW (UPF0749 family)